jgi:hypothetical protein
MEHKNAADLQESTPVTAHRSFDRIFMSGIFIELFRGTLPKTAIGMTKG